MFYKYTYSTCGTAKLFHNIFELQKNPKIIKNIILEYSKKTY